MKNKIRGKQGEHLAVEFLEGKGFSILETNYYASRYGEIDIIAKKDGIIVFVEVKTRTTLSYGHPFESINAQKLSKMQKAAFYYLKEKKPKYKAIRLDGIAVILSSDEIFHLENISF